MSFLSRFRGNVIAFPLAALAALAMLAISEASYQDATSSLDRLGERATARSKLNELVKSVLDAESGQRGYLLTERREYLRPYEQALSQSRSLLAWLNDYYAKNPRTAATMTELSKETEAKLSELATTIEMHDRGAEGAWRELVLSDIGREKMEHLRVLGERLLRFEGEQVDMGRRSVYQTLWLNRIGVSAMAALSLLALFMYLRQTATLDRALAAEAQRIAGERDRLEQEVAARTAQLRELAQHLQTIREDERSRLARELHDELGALLTAAKLDVARLKSRLGASASVRCDRAAGPPQRGAQRRHRAEAPDHRGPAPVVAQQSRPGRRARDPAARVRRAQRGQGGRGARSGRGQPRRAADDLPARPGGAHERRQVRQGERGRRQPAAVERRRRDRLGARQRHRLRPAASRAWPATG